MKFYAEPNLVVKFQKPIGLIKYIVFNDKGVFETKDENLTKKLMTQFKYDLKLHQCKYCEEGFIKKGDLLVHYRKHKEVTK